VKIAIVGTESTGKTRLVTEIGKYFGVPTIPEFARETAEEMGVSDIRGMTPQKTLIFQNIILEKKIKEESKYQTFIADRSTADNLAYYLRWCAMDVNDAFNSAYTRMCINHLKTYDHIILLPWCSIPFENDGFRSPKIYYLYEIHCLILGILKDFNIPYTILEETNLEKRVQYFNRFFIPSGTGPIMQNQRGHRPEKVL